MGVQRKVERREEQRRGEALLRPLHELDEELSARSTRVNVGLRTFDKRLRGIRGGELALIAGPPHHGKTQLALTIVANNPDVPILIVTPDEQRAKVLLKLWAVVNNVSVLDDGAPVPFDDVRLMAEEDFPLLRICDINPMTRPLLGKVVDAFLDEVGDPPQMVIFDFMDCLDGGPQDFQARPNFFRAFAKKTGIAMLVIHQSNRGGYADALDPHMGMLAGAGERQANQVIWVARPAALDEGDEDEIVLFILKNKDGRLTKPGGYPKGGLTYLLSEGGLVEEASQARQGRDRAINWG